VGRDRAAHRESTPTSGPSSVGCGDLAALRVADDEGAAGCLDDVVGDNGEVVDLQDAFDLDEQAWCESKSRDIKLREVARLLVDGAAGL
jgi:hypothetical protein